MASSDEGEKCQICAYPATETLCDNCNQVQMRLPTFLNCAAGREFDINALLEVTHGIPHMFIQKAASTSVSAAG